MACSRRRAADAVRHAARLVRWAAWALRAVRMVRWVARAARRRAAWALRAVRMERGAAREGWVAGDGRARAFSFLPSRLMRRHFPLSLPSRALLLFPLNAFQAYCLMGGHHHFVERLSAAKHTSC